MIVRVGWSLYTVLDRGADTEESWLCVGAVVYGESYAGVRAVVYEDYNSHVC